jgi:hypothetical protein
MNRILIRRMVMKKENRIVRIGSICLLTILFILSLCYLAAAESNSLWKTKWSEITKEDAINAFEATHYSLYYANRELRKLNYLNHEYSHLNDVFNKAATEWYMGQYYLDLVLCGEITDENEVMLHLFKAVKFFEKAQGYAQWIYKILTY